jgi:hypothetical protein
MTDFIDGLEQDLVLAARRQADRRSGRAPARRGTWSRWLSGWTLRTVLVAVVLGGSVATAGAAATLVALRGSAIPAPAAADVPREQTPVADTVKVSALRVADPDRHALPWTIRVARGTTGYVCSTVGQVSDGRFGLVGLDDRFRELAPALTDSCGLARKDDVSLVGARVFAGRRATDVRTVVNGVGGDDLRTVVVEASGVHRSVPVADGGTFLTVLRGYPEDLQLQATMTFADGRRRTENLGRDPSVVPDPARGPAWRAGGTMLSGDARQCVSFTWARRLPRQPRSPFACGLLTPPGGDGRIQRGVFFAVRRLAGDGPVRIAGGAAFPGDWNGRPARTAVWGAAGTDVDRVTVTGVPGGPRRVDLDPRRGRQFVVVLPGTVPPRNVRVRVRYGDGRTVVLRGDHALVTRAVPATPSGRRKP